jgi:hypothetical protein
MFSIFLLAQKTTDCLQYKKTLSKMYSSSSSRSKQTYRGSMFRTSGSNSVAIMNQFVTGLKNKNEEIRCKAARDLYHYVS